MTSRRIWLEAVRRENLPQFLPAQLIESRKRAGLTQRDLAERTGIKPQNISGMETGRRPAALDTVLTLADALHIDPSELIDTTTITLSTLRLRQRLGRADLARKLGVSYNYWYSIETGRRDLTDTLAERAATILQVSVDDFRAALHHQLET